VASVAATGPVHPASKPKATGANKSGRIRIRN
jgi:hypothetical protein